MSWFLPCRGEDLRICSSCRRHVDLHPQAAANPHQAFQQPATRGEQCHHWIAKPTPIKTPTSA